MIRETAIAFSGFVIAMGLLQNVVYFLEFAIASVTLARRSHGGRANMLWQRYADVAPPISLLVPAFNEEKSIVDSVRSVLALQYPNLEVIVINDGSRDNTLLALMEGFNLVAGQRLADQIIAHKPLRGIYSSPSEPRLTILDKENGGKADALNCGLNVSRTPLVCSLDADSILEPSSLLRVVRPFVDDPARTVAVGGTIRVANGCRIERGQVMEVGIAGRWLPLFQTIEYLRAFLVARLAWSRIGALTIVSGAFGLFRRQTVIDVGGYSLGTVGEDLELIVKIHRHLRDRRQQYRIEFVPEPVCWTEAPESLKVLARQRSRWQRGALETFFKHWDMMVKPRYGRVGMVGFLNIFLVDVIGPVIEMLGYMLIPLLWAIGILSADLLLAFLAVTFAYGVAISLGVMVLEEIELRRFVNTRDLVWLMIAAVVENFGYRQLNNIWRLQGLWQYLRGSSEWGRMVRTGFQPS